VPSACVKAKPVRLGPRGISIEYVAAIGVSVGVQSEAVFGAHYLYARCTGWKWGAGALYAGWLVVGMSISFVGAAMVGPQKGQPHAGRGPLGDLVSGLSAGGSIPVRPVVTAVLRNREGGVGEVSDRTFVR
jgi:hypothetical protein